MNMKKILLICNNYDSTRDGLGKYTKIMKEELQKFSDVEDVFVETGYTDDSNKIKMLFSIEMSKAIHRAIKKIKQININYIIVEYPFQEYNPLIILQYKLLASVCKRYKVILAISIHEYVRAKKLRKLVIDFMVRNSDITFVTDKITKKALNKKAKTIFYRDMIGTVFPNKEICPSEKDGSFIYFGLVNRSKAFNEMLKAWNEFNKDNKYHLKIITSSDISDYTSEKLNNIKVFYNLSEEKVAEHFSSSTYAIVPIIPEITTANGTFKVAALFGCICIGHFSKTLSNLDFIIDIDNYDLVAFKNGLIKAVNLSSENKIALIKSATSFGNKYSKSNTAKQVIEVFRKKAVF